MKNRIACAVAVAAAVGGAALVNAPAIAAQTPEVHVELSGNEVWRLSWTTYGVKNCDALSSSNGVPEPIVQLGDTTSNNIVVNASSTYTFQIRCPGSGSSHKATIYGPRNPINDARTMFNEYSRGVFGS